MSERKRLYGMDCDRMWKIITYFPPLAAIVVTGFCLGVIAAFWWAGNQ